MAEALLVQSIAQPDIVLELDPGGVIHKVNLSDSIPAQPVTEWIGRPWADTVIDPGRGKVRRIIDDALQCGVSAFRQVNQAFPGGLELPVEYTAVRTSKGGLIAVGKSLQAVAELQSRLNAAQQAIERDYWKLRDVETRCRLLFDRSSESVVLVRASDLGILEANPAAMRELDLSHAARPKGSGSRSFLQVADEERAALEAMLHRVRDEGKAPAILLHIGIERRPWLVRASLLPSQEGLTYLLQLEPAHERPREVDVAPVGELIARSPDAFVVLERSGTIVDANQAFVDLVQVGNQSAVVGQPLARWLGRPGADVPVLMSSVAHQGSVRLFTTSLQGELGLATEVEISATGEDRHDPRYLGALIRDVGSRLPAADGQVPVSGPIGVQVDRIGKMSLTRLVKEAAGVIERQYIDTALELTSGNRTAAAELLGVSRQSLHTKLNRYAAEDEEPTPVPIE